MEAPPKGASDRAFGLVIAVALGIVGTWSLVVGASLPWPWLAAAVAVLALALVRPHLLAPFNRAWTRLGLVLHRLVSPLVLGLLFFVAVTPIGLLMRLFGHDPLWLRVDRRRQSYWRERPPSATQSMARQF